MDEKVIRFSRALNAFAAIVVSLVLVGGFAVQVFLREQPCPLCLLQRAGMLGVIAGALFNLRLGLNPAHYAVGLMAALVGASVSIRQILLHIAPGSEPFGSPVMGLSLYTWAFIVFVSCMVGIASLLFFHRSGDRARSFSEMNRLEQAAFALALLVGLGNFGWTLAFCGLGLCE
jgi:disulfide bond formation protein DsbB